MAILAVIGVHSFQSAVALAPDSSVAADGHWYSAISYLRYGVELFFVLSGWLMFSLYYRNGRTTTRSYWARRILRLWPLWVLFTALSFAVSLTSVNYLTSIDGSAYSPVEFVIAFLICVFFLGWVSETLWNVPAGGWSIQVEVGHYLLFWALRYKGVLFLMVTALAGYGSYVGAKVISHVTQAGFIHEASSAWIRLGLYGTWPFFLAGGIAFLAAQSARGTSRAQFVVLALHNWVLLVIGAGVLLLSGFVPTPSGPTPEAIIGVVLLLGLSWFVSNLDVVSRLFQSWGRYSYFMYFAHFWVLNIAFSALESHGWQAPFGSGGGLVALYFIGFLILAIGVSWSLAVPSWRLFESKFLRIARRIS